MRRLNPGLGLLFLLQFLLRIDIISPTSIYEHSADQCDWIGSGGGGRGIRPVYLRCSRGTVIWRYPHGALRVVLSPPVSTGFVWKMNVQRISGSRKAEENRIINSRQSNVTMNTDQPVHRISGFRTCTKISGSIRVYLESRGKLRLLYSPRDGKHKASHRCFHAKKPPAALYIEADEPKPGERNDAKMQYDLELRYIDSLDNGKTYTFNEEEEDCRPCSTNELAQAYCQSDLVARGTVSAVQRQPNLEAAELVLGITKTLRQIDENEGNNDVGAGADVTVDRKNVRVRVPIACDARHGQGEFVIMAKRRLGDLVLVCAPRLESWAKAVRELKTPPCVLHS